MNELFNIPEAETDRLFDPETNRETDSQADRLPELQTELESEQETDDAGASTGSAEYIEDDIKTLDWREHIRLRPGMYIGKLGDGSYNDDGIYVLLKEVLDNAIDEYMMGFGRQVTVSVEGSTVTVRDYGRGIPLGKLVDVASRMNTGAKYDSKAFKKSVGLNGVGIKAVNALSDSFIIRSHRDGLMRSAEFVRGELVKQTDDTPTDEPNGTFVQFTPDNTIFRDFHFNEEFIVNLIRNYTYLNTGLAIIFNGKRFISRNGLLDLLKANMTKDPLYPIIHLSGDDIEIAITHANQYGEEYCRAQSKIISGATSNIPTSATA